MSVRRQRKRRPRAALLVRALEVGLEAEHPLVVELPVVTELAAADHAVHVVSRVRRADGCPRIGEPERAGRAAPAVADIAAEVEPGPVIDRIGEGAGCANGENGNRECRPCYS